MEKELKRPLLFNNPDSEYFRERGWILEASIDEFIEWQCKPWWKRLWLILNGYDRYANVLSRRGDYVK